MREKYLEAFWEPSLLITKNPFASKCAHAHKQNCKIILYSSQSSFLPNTFWPLLTYIIQILSMRRSSPNRHHHHPSLQIWGEYTPHHNPSITHGKYFLVYWWFFHIICTLCTQSIERMNEGLYDVCAVFLHWVRVENCLVKRKLRYRSTLSLSRI